MGRNKYSQSEIGKIAKLLRMKCKANRLKQKEIRHELRTKYEFNISDFNEPGKPFGPDELYAAIDRKAIQILDDATITDMIAKRERDRQKDMEAKAAENKDEQTDWQQALKEWNEWEKNGNGNVNGNPLNS